MADEIPLDKRALGIWIRAWQLAGSRWPPESRGIAHQIVMMLARHILELSEGSLSQAEAVAMARDALSPILAQRFYSGSEQDIVIERIEAVLKDAQIEGAS